MASHTHHGLHPLPHKHFRRGQLTMAIIVGIIAIAIIGGLMYQSGLITKATGRKNIESQAMAQAKLVPVRDYVQGCLDLALKDGLILIGKQGGYIYKAQGGLSTEFTPGEGGGRLARYTSLTDEDGTTVIQVPYAIFPYPKFNLLNYYYSETDKAPWAIFPMWIQDNGPGVCGGQNNYHLTDKNCTYHFDGVFGANLLPPLEKPTEGNLTEDITLAHPGNHEKIPSIQAQLEAYVAHKVQTCVDFEALKSTGLAFEPNYPDMSVNISFANSSSTIAELRFPIWMNDSISGARLDLREWASVVPVRLDYFYEIMNLATSYEVNSLLFFMSNQSADSGNIKPTIEKVKTPGSGQTNDYIIKYEDKASFIDDKPYVFQFAAHNRQPALYYTGYNIPDIMVASPSGGGDIPSPSMQPGPMTPWEKSVLQNKVCAKKILSTGACIPAKISYIPPGGSIKDHLIQVNNAPGCPIGKFEIPLFALDPDEDVPVFTITWQVRPLEATVDCDEADALQTSGGTIKVTAKDQAGLSDSQEFQLLTMVTS